MIDNTKLQEASEELKKAQEDQAKFLGRSKEVILKSKGPREWDVKCSGILTMADCNTHIKRAMRAAFRIHMRKQAKRLHLLSSKVENAKVKILEITAELTEKKDKK